MKTKSEHWVTEPKIRFGQVIAYGVSSWDIPDGHRLRREMTRSSTFTTVKQMERWAKKYGVDATREIEIWQKLVIPEA